MPNYKQTSIAGESWVRAYQIIIDNRYGQTPQIVFNEEEIADATTTTFNKHVSHIVESFSDPTKTFDLLNPVDGTVIGTVSYQDVYVMLSSLYAHLAAARDAV